MSLIVLSPATLAAGVLASVLSFIRYADAPAPDQSLTPLIVESRELVARHGDAIWPGFSDAPRSLILISGEFEYLFCHDGPADGFAPLSADPGTGCALSVRPRQFPPDLRASFPAVDGLPTTVVGTPQATGLSDGAWVSMLAHERFHQLQDALPGLAERTAALELDGGDRSGMWMLTYPFPYNDPEAVRAARALADTALAALSESDEARFRDRAADHVAARRRFLSSVGEEAARYYEFQAWKEGVARWTEWALARRASEENPALAPIRDEIEADILRGLRELDLAAQQRVAFYALGAADAEVLERLDPSWRNDVLNEALNLGPLLTAALDR